MPKQIKGVAESNIEEELLCYSKRALISVAAAGAGKLQTNHRPVWSEREIFYDFSIKLTLLGLAPSALPGLPCKRARDTLCGWQWIHRILPAPPSLHRE